MYVRFVNRLCNSASNPFLGDSTIEIACLECRIIYLLEGVNYVIVLLMEYIYIHRAYKTFKFNIIL